MITHFERRRTLLLLAVACGLIAGAVVTYVTRHLAEAGGTSQVVVSLTWDDGRATQFDSMTIQRAHGMDATYYVNSAMTGSSSYYMTKEQLDDLVATGSEIGGHTEHHVNVATAPSDVAAAEVCNDRARIASWYGEAQARSFAYPYGALSPAAQAIVKGCGYSSARAVTGVLTPYACYSCRISESLPSLDPYALVAPTSVSSTTTLADLQFQVTQARLNGGGWVIYTMHDLGVDGSSLSIDKALYDQFLGWLAGQSYVKVMTVGAVMGSTWSAPPTTVVPVVDPVPTPVPITNAGLETDADRNGVADCFVRGGFGTNTAKWSRSADAHSGSFAEEVTVSSFTSGDRKLVMPLDNGTAAGGCAPSVASGASYRLGLWFRSSTNSQLVVYLRDSAGSWRYWRSGKSLAASPTWAAASFDTGPVPDGTTALSFGLAIGSTGTLAVDDFSLGAVTASAPMVDGIVRNSSLEFDANNNSVPDCFSYGGYGTNNASWMRVADARTGWWGHRLTVSGYATGDRKLVTSLDAGQRAGGCAADVVAGTRLRLSAWYHSDANVTLFAYYRDATGWHWWLSGWIGGPVSGWVEASYVTPPLPTGATGVSFGVGLTSNGTITTDDYGIAVVS